MEGNKNSKSRAVAKKIAFIIVLVLTIVFGCRKPTVDLIGEPADTTIVYAIIDYRDTIHDIMVFKSVLGEDGSYAGATDLFPVGTIVYLEQGGNRWQAFPDTLDDSIMGLPYRIVYRARARLREGESFTVRVYRDEKEKAYVSPEPVGSWRVIYPSPFDTTVPVSWVTFFKGQRILFYEVPGANEYAFQIILKYEELINGQWVPREDTVELADLWKPSRVMGSGQVIAEIPLNEVLGRIGAGLPEPSPEVDRRRLDRVSFLIYAIGPEFYYYRLSQRALVSSLASGQVLPQWTNVRGGMGVVVARNSYKLLEYRLDAESLDSLACSDFTRHLKFQPSKDHPAFPYCQ
ncbi:MAG: hypothetical protein GXO48_02755 [Chlorobi bacterium]|nr:hypothetical protein [Chlorobiota bacterium]